MTKYAVANAADIAPGERIIVELEGRKIGVFNIDGEYYALLDQCPHAGAALCSFGTIFGVSDAEAPGEPVNYERNRSLRCPWHAWEYDIRTGESFFDPRNSRVRKYNVEVVPGSPEDTVDPDGGVQKGPYVMEGYEVTLDGDLVVVDTSRRRPARGPRAETASGA
ncbi:Rieske (2Fe-2S) protein [Saccharopolyspora spinosa]|uniref:3-phenylpropionate/trans-cinnamate dioxygenase ferredoxin subunit n=1 Tax=Saccharopolyspora spinosa TaxID=60894 RepID=A0A2N3Y122_SACSN|nr:Rieske (2Fe-2S) protein [Saccharopolyspora spinosa]PKW16634.1 3-phenylpropionate/trans-cinnamate dioxygenase ferredoxin subunit [Saccharopolyspora spinosa]